MFDVKFVFLWTDAVLWLLVLGLVGYVVYVHRTEELARKWRKVLNNKTAVAAAAVLSVFFAAALADSVHYRRALPATDGAAVAAWDTKTVSLLDALVGEKIAGRERSYSAPFSSMLMNSFAACGIGRWELWATTSWRGGSSSTRSSWKAAVSFTRQ